MKAICERRSGRRERIGKREMKIEIEMSMSVSVSSIHLGC